jgi:hypothetical protein
MATFGWDTLKMPEVYTRGANKQRLAERAMHMLEVQEQNSIESCPTEQPSETFPKYANKISAIFQRWCPGE